ncbi:hypothetical protein [Alloscardovia criceti]|uniref:hypothetical protein n=1 Tax=Alloscardovia criceti TaxID=356828 RepID=UPI00036050AE|nr:hypothetical protein [Alloscardovia criceti]
MKRLTHIRQFVVKFSVVGAWILQASILAFLLLLSLLTTVTFHRTDTWPLSDDTSYNTHLPSFHFLLGCVAVGIVLLLLVNFVAKLPQKVVFTVLMIYVMLVQIFWISSLGLVNYLFPDSHSVLDAAGFLLNGQLYTFDPNFCLPGSTEPVCINLYPPSPFTYFSYYPFQTGPLLWYVLLGSIFGAKNIFAFQCVSAVAITGLVAVLWRLGKFIGLNKRGLAAFAVLVMTCVPLLMFSAMVYPNAVGLFLTVLGVGIVAEAFRMERAWVSALTIFGGFAVAGIGIVFKSTFQIVVLAAIISIIFAVIFSKKYWQLIVAAVSSMVPFVISKVPIAIVQNWVGQDFGKGMPMLSWIALGLNNPEGKRPGWWTYFAIDAFRRTNNDYAAQTEISKNFVLHRFSEFAQNPSDAFVFFMKKLATEWSEPTFMTSIYSEIGESKNNFAGFAGFVLNGDGTTPLLWFENIMQTLTYLLALIGVIALLRTVRSNTSEAAQVSTIYAQLLLTVSFIGGFICFIFWEAKGIYTLPFFILVLPIAAYGVQTIMSWVAGLSLKNIKKAGSH